MDDNSEKNPVKRQLAKAELVWQRRDGWGKVINDAYEYAIPQRMTSKPGVAVANDKIFDMTAPLGTMVFAGNLQKDLFPPASAKFHFTPGPIFQQRLDKSELSTMRRELQRTSARIDPFFQTGDFDTAANEACWDLAIGTGAILPVHGDQHQPLYFVNVPFEHLATSVDAWGRTTFVSWKQVLTIAEIHDGFKDGGKFSKEFLERVKSKPNEEIVLYQDFFKTTLGWSWVAYTGKLCDEFIIHERSKTQPISVGRYSRAPGEPYGRGPVLLALASIKTLNKAQELALRSAAVQLLGIWAYRAGGTFNPDTVNIGAGEFWPMLSTGGVLGPDVQRIDPATGRLDVARVVIDGMREDIKGVLMDTRIAPEQGTPRSASEIVATLKDRADTNIGAYGRLSREFMPVLAPRAAEILYGKGYLDTPLELNELLFQVKVRSPMQQALDAQILDNFVTYFDLTAAIAGPENIDEHVIPDEVLGHSRTVLDIPEHMVPSEAERTKIRANKREAFAAQQAATFALEAAKVDPDSARDTIQ
ncbi:MAG: portal protein [Pseudomonadota bacterium]